MRGPPGRVRMVPTLVSVKFCICREERTGRGGPAQRDRARAVHRRVAAENQAGVHEREGLRTAGTAEGGSAHRSVAEAPVDTHGVAARVHVADAHVFAVGHAAGPVAGDEPRVVHRARPRVRTRHGVARRGCDHQCPAKRRRPLSREPGRGTVEIRSRYLRARHAPPLPPAPAAANTSSAWLPPQAEVPRHG